MCLRVHECMVCVLLQAPNRKLMHPPLTAFLNNQDMCIHPYPRQSGVSFPCNGRRFLKSSSL